MNELEDFIQPMNLENFFLDYWEKAPLFVKAQNRDRFSHLISTRVINELFATGYMRYPLFRLARSDKHVPVFDYTRSDRSYRNRNFEDTVNVEKIYQEYNNGSSIIIQLLEHTHYPIIELCKALESYFNHPISANAYLTPKKAQGLPIHFDTHSIFVLQIEGEKIWKTYNIPQPLPLYMQDYRKYDQNYGEPRAEIHLQQGDVLYIPRGLAHEAMSIDTHSLHVTIGVKMYTVYDAINELILQGLKKSQEDIAFRQSIPVGFYNKSETSQKEILSMVTKALDLLIGQLNLEDVQGLMASRMSHHQRLLYIDQLENINKLDSITKHSIIRKRSDLFVSIDRKNNNIFLEFLEKQVDVTNIPLKIINLLISEKPFQLVEIIDIEEKEKISLIKKLIVEGLLVVEKY